MLWRCTVQKSYLPMAGKLKTCTGQNILQLTIKLHINYFYKCHFGHCFTSTHRQIVVTLGRSLPQICELSLVLYFPHSSGNSCFPVPQISCAQTCHSPWIHSAIPASAARHISHAACAPDQPPLFQLSSTLLASQRLTSPISSHPEPRDLIHFTVFYKKKETLKLFPRPPPVDSTKP